MWIDVMVRDKQNYSLFDRGASPASVHVQYLLSTEETYILGRLDHWVTD